MGLRYFFAALLCAASVPAHADWYEASTKHFVVYSEQRPEQLKEFATKLEKFDKAMRFLRGMPDDVLGPANRLTVYVLNDAGDVGRLLGNTMAAGFYRARAGGSMAVIPHHSVGTSAFDLNSQVILLHEYTHHFMRSVSPHSFYPTWYAEGYAETFAATTFEKDGTVVVGNAAVHRAREVLSPNPVQVQRLLLSDPGKMTQDQLAQLYGHGWMLSHYLLLSDARQGQLGNYIAALNSGKKPEEAVAAFGELGALNQELERYKSQRLRVLRIPADKLPIGEVDVRKLTPGEAAVMPVRVRTKNGVNEKTAPGVYAAARKAAAPFPNDAGAQIILAETAHDAGDFAEAEAAADRALAADPKLVDGYVYKAMARMGVARKAKDKSPETWSAIRKIIATGNRLDPDDPEPLILYYQSFGAAGVAPTENASKGLLRAFDLSPQDSGLRMMTASMLLRQKKPAEARVLLATLAYAPHGRGFAPMAQRLMAQIDAGDGSGAAAQLEADQKDADKPDADDPPA